MSFESGMAEIQRILQERQDVSSESWKLVHMRAMYNEIGLGLA